MQCRHGDTPIERYMRKVQHSLYEHGYDKTMAELRILAPNITCLEDFFGYDPENSLFVYDSSTEDSNLINTDWPPLETPRQEPPVADTEAPKKSQSKKKPNKRQRQREAVPPEEPPSHPSPTLTESQPDADQQRRQGAITCSHARRTKQDKLCDKHAPLPDSVPDPTPPQDDATTTIQPQLRFFNARRHRCVVHFHRTATNTSVTSTAAAAATYAATSYHQRAKASRSRPQSETSERAVKLPVLSPVRAPRYGEAPGDFRLPLSRNLRP
ncbi:hypothetical protein ILUMI_20226 [Ignelater luminosus]|uniref:Uncharacterized protein n=1 Tax=Ignelater luminosus TaxID=2038154 RepID=A0A8K0CIL5_IGNLU|nr:hypothetical protein ILUMI_20226 [Ignelater luminosus]